MPTILPTTSVSYGGVDVLNPSISAFPGLELDEKCVADSLVSPVEEPMNPQQPVDEREAEQIEIRRIIIEMLDSGMSEELILSMMEDQRFAILAPIDTTSPYIVVSFVSETDESTYAQQNNVRPVQTTNTTMLVVPELEEFHTWSNEECEMEMEVANAGITWWDQSDDFLDALYPWSETSLASSSSSDTAITPPSTPNGYVRVPEVVDFGANDRVTKFRNTSSLLDMRATALSESQSYTYYGSVEPCRAMIDHSVGLKMDEAEAGTEIDDWSDDFEWADDPDVEVDIYYGYGYGVELSVIEEEEQEEE